MKILRFFSLLTLIVVPAVNAVAQLAFLFEPLAQSASPGADVLFLGTAYGPEPITYQWQKDGAPMPGHNLDYLYLRGVTFDDAGDYEVVASTSSGSITSQVAALLINGTFTKLTTDPLVNEGGNSLGSAWGDYDNDGDLDVFVAHAGTSLNSLFRNNGNGAFTKVDAGPVSTDYAQSVGATWADYDNDGWLDLLVLNAGQGATAFLYRNTNGTFSRVTEGLGADANIVGTASWGDYDKDGWVDLLLGPISVPGGFGGGINGGIYRNIAGVLTRQSNSVFTGFTFQFTQSAMWTDFDNDADPDMFFALTRIGTFFPGADVLARNNGNASFTRVDDTALTTTPGASTTASWADFDSDGDLDVYVGNVAGEVKLLFRNDGSDTFVQLSGEVAEEEPAVESAAWGDYDNDGWLDLFVANNGGHGSLLFRNDGNGGFTKVDVGSPTGDRVSSSSGVWIDVDNDGDLDLFVTNYGENNSLYRNNGNTNAWLSVKLQPDLSNRSAIGAKVRILATIAGVSRWQMREIGSRDSGGSPNSLRAEFGLGDATNITMLRVEWPSGLTTELPDVIPNQILTVREPPTVWAANAEIFEGDTGTRDLNFTVYLTGPSTNTVMVDFRTVNGTALAGTHYLATNGTLTFLPGETNLTLPVTIIANLIDNPNRTFTLRLSNSINMPIGGPIATGTIVDDDPLGLSAGSATVIEGDTGSITQLLFTVTLNKPWDMPVTANYTTLNQTAVAGQDYVATNGTLIFEPGETSKDLYVTVLGDMLSEINEIMFLDITSATGATIARRRGGGTINDDDPLPVLAVAPGYVMEGDSGARQLIFPFTLAPASGARVTVSCFTIDGKAMAPADYSSQMLTNVTLNAGATTALVSIAVQGDRFVEGNENFFLRISNVVNAVATTNLINGFIVDDDVRVGTPIVSGQDVRISFNTISNQNHRVEWTPSLDEPIEWTPVPDGESVTGNGSLFELIHPGAAGQPQRFYRIIVTP